MKLLCVLTTILGNKAFTERLIEAIDATSGVVPTYVLLESDDYRKFPAPRWARLKDTLEAQYVASQKIRPFLAARHDALLVTSWELMIACRGLAKKVPAAAAMDGIPATIAPQLRRRGQGGLKRAVSDVIDEFQFRAAVGDFRYFLPMGSDCRDALQDRYGVASERCFVTLAPQDLDRWKPSPSRSASDRMRLLLVTNDFQRKGGEFLMRVFSEHLSQTCTLTIASNDPSLQSRSFPAGVTVVRGKTRDELLELYGNADLFLFPTQQDYMPQVLAEALAAGLPCIANDVGGIRDLVRDGETGFLMSPEEPTSAWAEKIERLRLDPGYLSSLRDRARAFAEQNLDKAQFVNVIAYVLQAMAGDVKTRGASAQ